MTETFSSEHVLVLDQAWILAQSLVADEFRLDFHDFRSWPVDIKLYNELAPAEMAEGVFAQLFRYQRLSGPLARGARRDYYRICLYDPSILKAIESAPGLDLPALLTYILTHEFIHVARFAKFMELFSADDQARAEEEEVVHQETFRLLKKRKLPGLDRVLDLYHDHRLPVD